jgi:hypothetical protein
MSEVGSLEAIDREQLAPILAALEGVIVDVWPRWAPAAPRPGQWPGVMRARYRRRGRRRRHHPAAAPRDWFRLLTSSIYDAFPLHPDHLLDLLASGLSGATIEQQGFRTVPADMIRKLLGYSIPLGHTAYVIPYFDHAGVMTDHIRLKVTPAIVKKTSTMKYAGPRGAAPRLFIPLATREAALSGEGELWLLEGAKKSLSASQLGLPALGFEGIEAWHTRGSSRLLEDFRHVRLRDRIVELVPDGDVKTNPDVERGARRLADALREAGAQPRLVCLPEVVP